MDLSNQERFDNCVDVLATFLPDHAVRDLVVGALGGITTIPAGVTEPTDRQVENLRTSLARALDMARARMPLEYVHRFAWVPIESYDLDLDYAEIGVFKDLDAVRLVPDTAALNVDDNGWAQEFGWVLAWIQVDDTIVAALVLNEGW